MRTDNDGAESFFLSTDYACSAPPEPLPWARGKPTGTDESWCSENNAQSFTEVEREGAVLQHVWLVRSRSALVAHAWLFSCDLKEVR